MMFTSPTDKCSYMGQVVLRCRQMPNTFTVHGQTLNGRPMDSAEFCHLVADDEIEWRTEQRGTVLFDVLCVRLKRVGGQHVANRLDPAFVQQINPLG
jgi:hypothetical protein